MGVARAVVSIAPPAPVGSAACDRPPRLNPPPLEVQNVPEPGGLRARLRQRRRGREKGPDATRTPPKRRRGRRA
eukprot:8364463-Pyramimonas_sp.AAC.1